MRPGKTFLYYGQRVTVTAVRPGLVSVLLDGRTVSVHPSLLEKEH